MASVGEFLRALDSIEAEIRHSPDVVFVEMSLTCEEQRGGEVRDYVSRDGRHFILMTETWINVHWGSMCLDIGGPMYPFVWSPERSEVHDSFPGDFVKGLGVGSLRIWYYVDARRNPIPKKWLKDFPLDENDPYDDEDGRATMLHQADLERACNLMRSMKTAWSMAPKSVLREFGDLSMLLSMNPEDPDYAEEDIELWWPVALLTVAIRKSDVALSAKVEPYVPWHSIFDDLPAGGNHQTRLDEFKPTSWTVSLSVPSLLAATSCAVRAFRRAAEDSIENLDPEPKFEWSPPMLEGYVFALLKEVEYPTQRSAVTWIAKRSGRSAPSTSTLRKTFSWQIRPQKTPKPRSTNEAQSGVSPRQAADVRLSHEEVTNTVIDIQDEIHRQLSDDERKAVEWTLQQAGVYEEERKKAIQQLVEGFLTAGI
jgi:hypothetical protein